MLWQMQQQRPFLQSVLNAADDQTRRERFQAANADQTNAVSELVMNILRQRVPVSSRTLQRLHPHRQALRAMGRPQPSTKKRRQVNDATVGIGCVVRSQDSVQPVYPKMLEELSVPGCMKHVLLDPQTWRKDTRVV